jgi:hypothetical protein
MSLKMIQAALKAGGNERPFELGVVLKGNPESARGSAYLDDGLLVLNINLKGTTALTFIDPDEVAAVSVIREGFGA